MARNGAKLTWVCGYKVNLDHYHDSIKPQPNGCWEWTAAKHPQGYGMISSLICDNPKKRRMLTAHRFTMIMHLGRDLDQKTEQVIHTCGNPACCNPDHLIVGDIFARKQVSHDLGRSYGYKVPNRGMTKQHNRRYRWTEEEILFFRHQPVEAIQKRFGVERQKASSYKCRAWDGYKWLKDPK